MNKTIDNKFPSMDEIPDFDVRRVECRQNGGHMDPHWHDFMPGYSSNVVEGICTYCLTPLTRYPTAKERAQEKEFYRSMEKPLDF